MPELSAVASMPIAFSFEGSYFLIPLSAVYFDDQGVPQASRWPRYSADVADVVDALLNQLVSARLLVPGPEPVRRPAFFATAKTAGARGIGLTIEIADVEPDPDDPPESTATFTVTETNTYSALALADLRDTIGTEANGGARPGLVFVSSAGTPTLPVAGAYTMVAAAGDVSAEVDSEVAGTPAFVLQTRASGADAVLVEIEIADVDDVAETFTLISSWTKEEIDLAMTDLPAAFSFVLEVTAPSGGFRAPTEGSHALEGGADSVTTAPVRASAVVLSS